MPRLKEVLVDGWHFSQKKGGGKHQSQTKKEYFMIRTLSTISSFIAVSVAQAAAHPSLNELKVFGTNDVCGERIALAVVQAATERFGKDNAETLNIREVRAVGDFGWDSSITPFKVTATDEVGGHQWLVVAETEDCVIEFLQIANEE
jgi:hypothetical protein